MNPNGIEFDNLYLDMNGIIHPCVHPEDVPPPETEEDMFLAIFAYIDRLVRAVRPRKLLYMAIDGVAPRAKMNQQRARRFKAAQEIQEREEVEEEIRAKLVARGHKAPPKSKHSFDHNVITPGTVFMDRLAFFLRYYLHDRQTNDPTWKAVRVVLSDASVPGEGEHKIMEFVRQQRACPGFNPNTRHILHGLDADLIMLGLATHEGHFTILREEVMPPKGAPGSAPNACFVCGESGHRANECPNREAKEKEKAAAARDAAAKGKSGASPGKPLQFLHLPILREYLAMEFEPLATAPGAPWPVPYDLERVVDDFVFLCFFVGNDFLPHLPSLDIREGAIDLLLALYKSLMPRGLGGYLTHAGHVSIGRAGLILEKVGALEDEIFKRRRRKEERERSGDAARKAESASRAVAAARGVDPTAPRSRKSQVDELLADWKSGIAAASVAPAPKRQAIVGPGGGPVAAPIPVESSNRAAAAAMRAALVSGGGAAATPPAFAPPPGLPSPWNEALSAEDVKLGRGAGAGLLRLVLVEGGAGGRAAEVAAAALPAPLVAALACEVEAEMQEEGTVSVALSSSAVEVAAVPMSVAVEGETPSPEGEEEEEEEERDLDVMEREGARDLADSVKAMLKEAVVAALEAKHTHEDVVDAVALGLPGWKERYYGAKFGRHAEEDGAFVGAVCRDYAAGLVWVFKYYLQGVASWKWFYPHHYAPFASDVAAAMRGMGGDPSSCSFELGRPFRPLDQLMGVLPSLSSHALPQACGGLMADPASPVHDFYPEAFAQDPNGKKMSWLWVVLLPFIDEGRLVGTMDSVAHTFTGDERRRNLIGNELLFVHAETGLGRVLASLAPSPEEVAACSSWTPPPIEKGAPGAPAAPPFAEESAVVLNISEEREAREAGAGGVDLARVPGPAISPAVTEALAAGSRTGRMMTLRPDQGDPEAKGVSGRALPLAVGNRYGWGASVGGTFASPLPARLPDLQATKVVQVVLLPPPRRAHICATLPGMVPAPPRLTQADDPSGVIPRLSRGMNIADLAGELNRRRDEGVTSAGFGGYAASAFVAQAQAMVGGGGGYGVHQYQAHQQQQHAYGAPPQGVYYAPPVYAHPLAAMAAAGVPRAAAPGRPVYPQQVAPPLAGLGIVAGPGYYIPGAGAAPVVPHAAPHSFRPGPQAAVYAPQQQQMYGAPIGYGAGQYGAGQYGQVAPPPPFYAQAAAPLHAPYGVPPPQGWPGMQQPYGQQGWNQGPPPGGYR